MRIFAIIAATILFMGCSEEAPKPSAQMLCDQIIDLENDMLTAKKDDKGAADRLTRKWKSFIKTFEALSTEQRVEGYKKATIVLKEKNQLNPDLFKAAGNPRAQQIYLDVLEADPSTIDAKAHTFATMAVDNMETHLKQAKALRG